MRAVRVIRMRGSEAKGQARHQNTKKMQDVEGA